MLGRFEGATDDRSGVAGVRRADSHVGGLRSKADERRLRLFACALCRTAWAELGEDRSRRAIDLADGPLSEEVRERTAHAAYAAVSDIIHNARPAPSAELMSRPAFRAAFYAFFCVSADVGSIDHHFATVELGWFPPSTQVALLRDIFGNSFRPVTFSPSWRTGTAVTLAARMYESCDFSALPILADALQDAGCDCAEVLDHCRGPGPHVRGCWVLDLVLGME